ncbi:ATPase [Anaeromyxobacter sp. Red801]|uniref:ATPase n=1 Tax=Anaeromyxobacter sp. Red801 TaxID=3411632 RepID=UPI003BA1C936
MILPMTRVELVGPRDALPAALGVLQAQAVVELRAREAGTRPLAPPEEPAPEEAARAAGALRRIEALDARLPPVPPRPAGARAPPPLPALPPPGSDALDARLAALEQDVAGLERRRDALARERDATDRFARLLLAVAPLDQGPALGPAPELHGVLLRRDPAVLALLEAEVRRACDGACEVRSRDVDAEWTGVLLLVPRERSAAVAELLAARGVEETALPADYAGKPIAALLPLLAARRRAIPGELARNAEALAARAAELRPALAAARQAAAWAVERREAVARCGGTRFAFVVSGYMPEERVPALRAEVGAALGGRVAVFARQPEPAEWGEVPVVLRNRPRVRPFGRLLALTSLPRYGSIDPTPWLAISFPVLFGLVLGDVAFGLIGMAAALVARRARWGGEVGRDLAAVAGWCSASAALFGLLYGEALGGLGAALGLRPLLLDRREALLSFLALALAVGGVHVAIGMALGVAGAARARRWRQATGRAARLALLAVAAAAAGAALGALPRAVLAPALWAAGACLAAAVLAEGPLALLDLVLGIGNVLSYSRLMALGLASVMLAEAANLVARTLEPRGLGIALGVLLHAVNYTLGLVGPTIAALRLHYVEFFERFYEEGGFPFHPFGQRG